MSNVQSDLPVLVAGGGIGGLAAALALVRQGFTVQVFEQAPEIGEIGAGIQLGPNAFHAFDALGVGDKARGRAVYTDYMVMHDALDEYQVGKIETGEAFRARFGNPYAVIHRVDVHKSLLEGAVETGKVAFFTNTRISQVEQDEAGKTVTAIDQGTTSVDFILSVTNTGTVDLFSINLFVDDASGEFTFVPADHWEGDSTVSYAWVEVGDLDVGESIDVPMTVGFAAFIPAGLHKLMFGFDGYYYDPDEMGYRTVDMWWTGSPCAPHVVMNGYGFTLTSDESTVAGPFVMLDVADDAIDFSLTSVTELSTGGQLIDNGVMVTLQNYGNIDYTNVVLTMVTNDADSPFLNAVDPTAAESEPVVMPGTVNSGSSYSVTFRVTLMDDADMGIFMVPVNVRGINDDMGVFVEDTVEARITIMGVGPKLVITSSTPSKINPGATFDLTLTIENQGDDTARGVILWSANNAITGTGNSEENGDLEAPVPLVSPMVLPDIGPGDNITVVIKMRSNEDMSGGHVYQVSLGISYVDSYGYGPSSSETYYDIAIKSNGMGGSALGNLYFVLMLVGIVCFVAIIVIVLVWARKNWVPRRKKNAPVIVGQQPAYEQQPPQQ